MAHVMGPGLHVADLDRSVKFYTDVLGLKIIGEFGNADREVAGGEQSGHSVPEVCLAYDGSVDDAPFLALLTHVGRTDPYVMGDAFRKVMIMVDDLAAVCARGPEYVTREMVEHPKLKKRVAFMEDPDGYRLELIQCL